MMVANISLSGPVTLIKTMFVYVAPLNLVLAFLILSHNSIILKDSFKDRTRLATAMFILIASADIVTAVAEIARGTTALVCSADPAAGVPAWTTFTFLALGFYSYCCSIFYNVVLAILKTINFSCPFYYIKKKRVFIAIALFTVTWAGTCVLDVVLYARKQSYLPSSYGCAEQWTILLDYDFTGKGLALQLFDTTLFGHDSSLVVMKLTVACVYLVPCLLVFVCMVVQMTYINKTLMVTGTSRESTARHVNLTVFMVSTLFLFCTSSYGIFFLLEFAIAQSMTQAVEFIVKYTLPLVNAALFPVIIICRKTDLRKKYSEYWRAISTVPVCCRRKAYWRLVQGYQPLHQREDNCSALDDT